MSSVMAVAVGHYVRVRRDGGSLIVLIRERIPFTSAGR
jgi:hypothetical protein